MRSRQFSKEQEEGSYVFPDSVQQNLDTNRIVTYKRGKMDSGMYYIVELSYNEQ